MFKRILLLAVATVLFAWQALPFSAAAVELSAETRTVKLNEAGETVTLSTKQVQNGRKVFTDTCAQCHVGGITKTDFNVGLGTAELAGATPARDNIAAMVEYIKHPTTYDGETPIPEIHPSKDSTDIFPEMKNLSEADMFDVAGHILIQPKVLGSQWGGGKAIR
jgi:photosystem II cytochrome c550